jgi:outer membrane protein TolC
VHLTFPPLLFGLRSAAVTTTAMVAFTVVAASPAAAQIRRTGPSVPETSPTLGGVPTGTVTAEPIRLTAATAIYRALDYNLGVLLSEQNTETARGERWNALSRLLPDVSGTVSESVRKNSLEAFGFPLGPGFPSVVGPYDLFDARLFISQTVFDQSAFKENSAASHRLAAAKLTYRNGRDLVVLVSASLYLQALATEARSAAVQAQFESSQALYEQATSLQQSGLVAGLDVVRAEVRMSTDRQRATAARNDAEKAKLRLARVIGLPIGQSFTLVNDLPNVPDPTVTLEEAVEQAYRQRPDYLAAVEQLKATEDMRSAAAAERLPSVRVTSDIGTIGLTASDALKTYNVTGAVSVPIFNGGRTEARVIQADAELKRQQASVADLKAQVYYDVRTAFLDLEASRQQMETATRARELAAQQLEQSRDRFAAGVASNIEVVQAQEAVALATDQFISAVYDVNIAKAMLAQSVGTAEDAVRKYLGGPTQ